MFHYTDVLHIVKLFLGRSAVQQTAWRRTPARLHNAYPTACV